jgi:hypothetical protein
VRPPHVSHTPAVTLYGAIIGLSAFLLFLVQPLIAKLILPRFGGAAAVWSAALLFFHVLLMAGYAYAHGVARYLRPRAQAGLHIGLLAASCAVLPILPSAPRAATPGGDPATSVLAVLAATVGPPCFMLSTTSPLLQAWWVRASGRHGPAPYRLFALSNLGALLALVAFPAVLETHFGARAQAYA